jgi:hypothetical protein
MPTMSFSSVRPFRVFLHREYAVMLIIGKGHAAGLRWVRSSTIIPEYLRSWKLSASHIRMLLCWPSRPGMSQLLEPISRRYSDG